MVAGISYGHVVVVSYHEKAPVVVDTCVLEVTNYVAGSELEAVARSDELGAVENNEHGVENKAVENDVWEGKNEVVVHGEPEAVVKGEQEGENKVAVCGELGVVVHGVQEEVENEVAVCSELGVVVHGVQAVVHDEQGVVEGGEPGKGLAELHGGGGGGDGHGGHYVCG